MALKLFGKVGTLAAFYLRFANSLLCMGHENYHLKKMGLLTISLNYLFSPFFPWNVYKFFAIILTITSENALKLFLKSSNTWNMKGNQYDVTNLSGFIYF